MNLLCWVVRRFWAENVNKTNKKGVYSTHWIDLCWVNGFRVATVGRFDWSYLRFGGRGGRTCSGHPAGRFMALKVNGVLKPDTTSHTFFGTSLCVGPEFCIHMWWGVTGGGAGSRLNASFGYSRVRFWGSSVSKRAQNCGVRHCLGVFWGCLATVGRFDCSQTRSRGRGGGGLAC